MTTTAETKIEEFPPGYHPCSCGRIAVSHTMPCIYDTVTGAMHHFDGTPCFDEAD